MPPSFWATLVVKKFRKALLQSVEWTKLVEVHLVASLPSQTAWHRIVLGRKAATRSTVFGVGCGLAVLGGVIFCPASCWDQFSAAKADAFP